MKKTLSNFIALFYIFALPVYAYSFSGEYTWSTLSDISVETSASITDTTYTDDSTNPLNLDCGSCILIEQSTR